MRSSGRGYRTSCNWKFTIAVHRFKTPRRLPPRPQEFAEIEVNEKLGYATPADVAERYPRFFWNKVEPYTGDAIRHLELTMEGRQWIAQLYSNVFAIEHHRQHMGPQLADSQMR